MIFTRLNDSVKGLVSTVINAVMLIFFTRERAAREAFEKSFLELPLLSSPDNADAAESDWTRKLNRLRDLATARKAKNFLRWDVIRGTMFLSSLKKPELRYLRQHNWELYGKSLREVPIGNPVRSWAFRSSGNLVHQAYHVSQLLEGDPEIVKNLRLILEFGGGYGCMCNLLLRMGFRGKYLIFDFPHLALLQKYYLTSIGWELQPGLVSFVSDLAALKAALNDIPDKAGSLLIATWSISETPLSFRDEFLPLTAGFEHFLMAFQNRFTEVDNRVYFEKLKASLPSLQWKDHEIEHDRGNSYLVGHKRRPR